MKKTHIVIISVLAFLVIVLIILCSVLYLKNEYIEDQQENRIQDNSNDNTTVQDNDINNDSSSNQNNNKYISSEEALQVVLNDLKINKEDIYDLDNELEYKYGKQVYEIDFKYNRYEYDYYINAENGEIVKSFKERD